MTRNRKRRREKERKVKAGEQEQVEFEIEASIKSKVNLWLETKCVSPSSLLLSPPTPPSSPSYPEKESSSGQLRKENIESNKSKNTEDCGDFEDVEIVEEHFGVIDLEEEDEEPVEEEEEQEEEEECTAEDLVKVLTSCRVCFESQDTPENSIWCILGHLKYLCIFCFRIVEKEDLVRHTRSEKSKERCIEGRKFKCPYLGCSDLFYKNEDSFVGVHDLFERLYFHVVNCHLPKSYERLEEEEESDTSVFIKEEELENGTCGNNALVITSFHEDDDEKAGDNPCESDADRDKSTIIQEAKESELMEDGDDAVTVIDVVMEELDGNSGMDVSTKYKCTSGTSPDSGVEETLPEEQTVNFSGGSSAHYQRFQRYSSEPSEEKTVLVEEDDDVVILSVTKRKPPPVPTIGTAFVCGFCDTAFNLKRRLHDHYEKKSCKKLKDKKCQNCQIGFAGFTVLEVVKHLFYNCQPEPSS